MRQLFAYHSYISSFFFFNDTATTEIYTLSLHDALPICPAPGWRWRPPQPPECRSDRKSTRLNSSHEWISYAVFCLKKKKQKLDTNIFYKQRKLQHNSTRF